MPNDVAVLSMHLQNEVVHPDGFVARRGNAEQVAKRGVLPNARRVMERARAAGRPVIHLASGHLRGHPTAGSVAPIFRSLAEQDYFLRGSWGASFHEDVTPAPGDAVVYHNGIGLFYETDLLTLLHAYQVRKVVLFGVATRLVVEAAVFELTDRGFECLVVEDCCASGRPELHEQAIEILRLFATITSTNDVLEVLGNP